MVGAHVCWCQELTEAVDRFCEKYNGAVFCDQTSNYKGKYGIMANLVAIQRQYRAPSMSPDLLIHIGEVSGAYMNITPKNVWRVNPDGEIRDTFRKLNNVFEMEEVGFFRYYAPQGEKTGREPAFFREVAEEYAQLRSKIAELPFSSVWIAEQTAPKLPDHAVLHLGILNSLRTWNYFEVPKSVAAFSNVGGFGIDGSSSTVLGASLASPEKLYFLVLGDLAFFYDMNVLASRHIGRNLRIMLVNNGTGFEMKYYKCAAPIEAYFGSKADDFFAAKGHFGRMSRELVKRYAEDLGFIYLTASNKEEYLQILPAFVAPEMTDKPILLEVFTNEDLENDAQKKMDNLLLSANGTAKNVIKNVVGPKNLRRLKELLKG